MRDENVEHFHFKFIFFCIKCCQPSFLKCFSDVERFSIFSPGSRLLPAPGDAHALRVSSAVRQRSPQLQILLLPREGWCVFTGVASYYPATL